MDHDEVLLTMRGQLRDWQELHDGRAVFLDCYCRMTDAMDDALGDDRFADPDWVADLLDRFAVRYLDSIDGGDGSVTIPAPWVLAHAAAVGRDATTMQLLLAGVNAHINYDLVLTLVDLLDEERVALDEALLGRRRRDFDEVNRVIEETADLVQDLVVEAQSPLLDLLDRGLGRWDERVAVKLLTGWRRRVWRQAVEIVELTDDERRRARIEAIEHQCERRARWILI